MSTRNVAIQGLPGSFHHQVALRYFGEDVHVLECSTFEEVASAVARQEVAYGVLAIENSIAGAILPNYELIDRHHLQISDEHYLPIAHHLMALPGQDIQHIREVRSHPMALLQCQAFFAQHPHLQPQADTDTATVAKRIRQQQLRGVAAIASEVAASIYELQILASHIQTVKENYTRFVIVSSRSRTSPKAWQLGLALHPDQQKRAWKTSIKVAMPNQAGILARLLSLIAEAGADLSKIQSVPLIQKPWEYAFFMDLCYGEPQLWEQLRAAIEENFGQVTVFGTYQNRLA
ncbi:MAG: prephenate dehydratase [Nitritalea sp.]